MPTAAPAGRRASALSRRAALPTGKSLSAHHQIDPLEQPPRNRDAVGAPPPDPVVDEDRTRGWVPIDEIAIADECERDHDEIRRVADRRIEHGVPELDSSVQEAARDLQVIALDVDNRQRRVW